MLSAAASLQGEPSVMLNRGAGDGQGAEVFARDAAGAVVHLWWSGSAWTDFVPLGTLAAASDPFGWIRADGHGEVFAIDGAGNLMRSYRDSNGAWSAWTSIAANIDPCVPPPVAIPADGGTGDDAGTTGGASSGTTGGGTSGTGASGGSGVHGGCSFAPSPPALNGALFALALTLMLRRRRRPT